MMDSNCVLENLGVCGMFTLWKPSGKPACFMSVISESVEKASSKKMG